MQSDKKVEKYFHLEHGNASNWLPTITVHAAFHNHLDLILFPGPAHCTLAFDIGLDIAFALCVAFDFLPPPLSFEIPPQCQPGTWMGLVQKRDLCLVLCKRDLGAQEDKSDDACEQEACSYERVRCGREVMQEWGEEFEIRSRV